MKISNYRLLLWKTSNPCARYNLKCAPWEELSSLVPPSVEDKVMSMEAHKWSIRFLHTWWNIVLWFWPSQLHLVWKFWLGSYLCHVFQNMVVLMNLYVAWLFKTCDDAQLLNGPLDMDSFWSCISFCLWKVPSRFWHDGSLWLWSCTWSSLFNQTLGGL